MIKGVMFMGVMNRSEINKIVDNVIDFIHQHQVVLPKFGYFTLQDWKKLDLAQWQEVFDVELGWDVSDFGGNDFSTRGCVLFNFRNGSIKPVLKDLYPNPYAEKMLFVGKDQELPMHFHHHKMEDIINRGGGDLLIELYNSTKEEELDKVNDLHLSIDGQKLCFKPGSVVCLKPGSSIRVNPRVYHRFWAEKESVMAWEVSKTNDDHVDNRFLDNGDRFSQIIEDEPIKYVLCNEYEKVLAVSKSNEK